MPTALGAEHPLCARYSAEETRREDSLSWESVLQDSWAWEVHFLLEQIEQVLMQAVILYNRKDARPFLHEQFMLTA